MMTPEDVAVMQRAVQPIRYCMSYAEQPGLPGPDLSVPW